MSTIEDVDQKQMVLSRAIRFTRDEWRALTPFQKGYAVCRVGAREDEPNIPERYRPPPQDRAEYERGQALAIQDAQDSEE